LPSPTDPAHLRRCHLADPIAVFEAEVLPEIAPELVEETH
jgi:peptide/nickel transport system ATP-binding protein